MAFTQAGNLAQAQESYQKAIALLPHFPEAKTNLGQVLALQGHIHEAQTWFLSAIADRPLIPAYANLILVCFLKGEAEEAHQYCLAAIELYPESQIFSLFLAHVLYKLGRCQDALKAFTHCKDKDSRSLEPALGGVMAQLPMIYEDEKMVKHCRDHYQKALEDLEIQSQMFLGQADSLSTALGVYTPFYLAYQGYSDKPLMAQYGRVLSALNPQRMPQVLSYPKRDRLRVGFVSGFFSAHTVYKLMLKGWISQLNPQEFEVRLYATRLKQDAHTDWIRQHGVFYACDSFRTLASHIEQDQPDVLIYPEVGMDLLTYRLAACRLAPTQCVSWGHPTTTGLSTIDYFLSSDLMERDGARADYTESLVLLPNLSIYYDFVTEAVPQKMSPLLCQEKLTEKGRVRYLCCQALPKYLPQYDSIWVDIAKQVPEAQFIFITHASRSLTHQFLQRVSRVFLEAGLDPYAYLVMMPPLSFHEYLSLNAVADVYLDSIGWSGGNTTLEAVAYHVPIVTWPQALMRSRHAAAILTRMGLSDWVTHTRAEYIDTAIQWGKQPALREKNKGLLQARKHKIYQDLECVAALEKFIRNPFDSSPV